MIAGSGPLLKEGGIISERNLLIDPMRASILALAKSILHILLFTSNMS